jgi:predicted HTH domain antitoxin
MKNISIKIPEEIMYSVKIPRKHWEIKLKQELALQLYREGLISYANAHRMAELSKIEFHYLLGDRSLPRQYDLEDYEKDIENLAIWRAGE